MLGGAEKQKSKTDPVSCPGGWTKGRNACYYMSTQKGTFNDAIVDCQNRNAEFSYPRNIEELMLLNILRPSQDAVLWFNIQRSGDRWLVGKNKDVTSDIANFWRPGEPNNDGGNKDENCLHIWAATLNSYILNDIPCTTKSYWLV